VSTEPPRRPFSPRRVLFHDLLACGALVLWVLAVTPPVLTLTGEYEFAQSTQFCLFAIVIPALLVVGGPWRWINLASLDEPIVDSDGHAIAATHSRPLDRWVRGRSVRKGYRRAVALLLIFVAQAILWRSAPVVDALIRHPWLSIVESFTLVVGGALFWLELVESAPFRPTTARPYRIGVAAVAMWTVWVIAYLMAMAQNTWYSGFRHVSGRLFSLAVDQQVTTALMWFISACALLPIIFSNLNRWLQSEEDPDEELYQLVRRDRSRGFFGTNP
jgi:cytochrome c oxidase assembly factor CtaG